MRGRLLTLGAGLLAAAALVFTARNFTLSRRTFELSAQGQLTDRYTKAVEQLGSENLAVRIGGIYALDRIARDSERDYPTVIEVLAAFIREQSRMSLPSAGQEGEQDIQPLRGDLQAPSPSSRGQNVRVGTRSGYSISEARGPPQRYWTARISPMRTWQGQCSPDLTCGSPTSWEQTWTARILLGQTSATRPDRRLPGPQPTRECTRARRGACESEPLLREPPVCLPAGREARKAASAATS